MTQSTLACNSTLALTITNTSQAPFISDCACQADEADLQAFEERNAEERSKGLFFKSLYVAPKKKQESGSTSDGSSRSSQADSWASGSSGNDDSLKVGIPGVWRVFERVMHFVIQTQSWSNLSSLSRIWNRWSRMLCVSKFGGCVDSFHWFVEQSWELVNSATSSLSMVNLGSKKTSNSYCGNIHWLALSSHEPAGVLKDTWRSAILSRKFTMTVLHHC